VGLVLVWGGIVAAAVGLVFFRPLFDTLAPTCFFRQWTGLLCPGCGVTRAMRALASGSLLAAIDYNPLAVVALPFVMYEMVVQTSRAFGGPRMRSAFDGVRVPIIAAAVVIAYFVVRNLPFWPFVVLRP
jgi:hypothetical protein